MSNRIETLIQSKVSLAPMAGITDYVLRSLVRKYSKNCLLTTEMISSEYLAQTMNGRSGTEILKRDKNHSPISYQISGHKPFMMRQAAEFLNNYADIIDINMGCPVKKVVGGQDGCALMRTPELASDLVKAVKDGTDKPVSVKFRLGYTNEELNYVEFGQKMQEAGAEFITIHARTRAQMYSGQADWEKIRKLKENVDIPVFANGDVTSIEKAIECTDLSGADGIAVGRGALGDPTLIGRIEHYFATGEKLPIPSLEERIEMLKIHLDEEIKLRGENAGIKFMRKFYPYYFSGFENAKQIRSKLVVEDNLENIYKFLVINTY
ncbi:tRNA dihydrouridine synthase DusB [bacterium]|nr:tRNA dihydrouridine synthase DusB [bacterium]